MKHKIYVDLDGVMANFEKGIVDLTGIHYWDRLSDRFWDRIGEEPNFFYNLDLLPGSFLMLEALLIKHGTDIVEILTATPRPTNLLATADEDKRRWVRDLAGDEIVVNTVVGGKNKYKFLEENPRAVLIDDYERNIKLWVEHGGCGILHTDPDSTITKLKLLGLL